MSDSTKIDTTDAIVATFIGITEFRADTERHVETVCGDYERLTIVLRGVCYADDGSGPVTAHPGDVLYFPRHVERQEWNNPDDPLCSYQVLCHWQNAVPDLPCVRRDEDGRLRTLAEWLYAEREFCGRLADATRSAYLQALVGEYVRLCGKITLLDEELVRSVRNHVKANIAERLALDDLAHFAGMDKYHFIRKYRALTGRTPIDDVRRLRVQQARFLAVTTDHSFSEIAEAVGFPNHYHLSKMFKRYLNMSPKEIRRQAPASRIR
jgi:AraC-like DNA-binding protein